MVNFIRLGQVITTCLSCITKAKLKRIKNTNMGLVNNDRYNLVDEKKEAWKYSHLKSGKKYQRKFKKSER